MLKDGNSNTAIMKFLTFLVPFLWLSSSNTIGVVHGSSSSSRRVSGTINLPRNDINIVVVTDVHSWIAGHKRHEPTMNADYGHVLSFYEQLQSAWSNENLFFVMNGDFTDGTGLSTYPPIHLTPILKTMPWDALNIGNHELYRSATVEHITANFTSFWGERYVTSNVLRRDAVLNTSIGPLGGARYTTLVGPSGTKLLTFGFLYDMTDHSALVTVEPVAQVVEQSWFVDVLSNGDFQAILCLVHMDVNDGLIRVLLNKMRSIVGNTMPIQFISGHTHIRSYSQVDDHSTSFEAGHYLDTVGFISFDLNGTNFEHVFIEANVDEMQSVLSVDDMMTDNGRKLQNMISSTQEEMGLTQKYGCSPQHYYLEYGLAHPQSLWALFIKKVVQSYYFGDSPTFVYVQGTGGFRYDLYPGEVILDDLMSVSPYNDTIYKVIEDIKGSDLLKVMGGRLNSIMDAMPWLPELPEYVCSVDYIDPEKTYEFYTAEFDLSHFVDLIGNVTGRNFTPVAQNMATTQLWIDFVSHEWQRESLCMASKSSSLLLVVGVGIAFSIVILGVVFVVWRRRQSLLGYDMAHEITRESHNGANEEYDDELI